MPFELRSEDVSPADALISDFNEAKDVKAKILILESVAKDLSSFEDPAKSASKNNQFNKGGVYLIRIKIINKVRAALKVDEFTFLLNLSNNLIPLNSILTK